MDAHMLLTVPIRKNDDFTTVVRHQWADWTATRVTAPPRVGEEVNIEPAALYVPVTEIIWNMALTRATVWLVGQTPIAEELWSIIASAHGWEDNAEPPPGFERLINKDDVILDRDRLLHPPG